MPGIRTRLFRRECPVRTFTINSLPERDAANCYIDGVVLQSRMRRRLGKERARTRNPTSSGALRLLIVVYIMLAECHRALDPHQSLQLRPRLPTRFPHLLLWISTMAYWTLEMGSFSPRVYVYQ